MHTVFRKALWDQRKSLLGWGLALGFVILLESALWPSMRSMPNLDEYLQEFPAPLRDLFGMDQMTTGTGFLNAELFTLMLPMLFIVYGVTRGAKMIAGEEEAGTLDLLLVTPLSTTRLLVDEVRALASGVAILGGVVLIATLVGSATFDLRVGPYAAFAGSLAVTILGVEFGTIALVAGALTGRHGVAIAVPAGLGLAAYVLFIGGTLVEGLNEWSAWSPFRQALHEGPLSSAIPASTGWVVAVPILACVAVIPAWSRRDIGRAR